jgi:hypothetical protein
VKTRRATDLVDKDKMMSLEHNVVRRHPLAELHQRIADVVNDAHNELIINNDLVVTLCTCALDTPGERDEPRILADEMLNLMALSAASSQTWHRISSASSSRTGVLAALCPAPSRTTTRMPAIVMRAG